MKNKPVLTAVELAPMLVAARDAATARGLTVTIAIVDDGGYPLRLERMDSAGAMTPQVALAKARTAALARGATRSLAERVVNDPGLLRLTEYLPMSAGCRSSSMACAWAGSACRARRQTTMKPWRRRVWI